MKKLIIATFLLACLGISVRAADSQTASPTFRNPVLWADVPDPDVIRVGNDFYLVSTTMHLMPGGPVMTSKDLVNWHTVSYLFDRLIDSPKYDMRGGTVYGLGQWATSLKYHNGMFYALFAPNDSPGGESYLYQTKDPRQGWTLRTRLPHFHDCSLFFDDDDRVYVFHGTGIVKMDLGGMREGDRAGLSAFNGDAVQLMASRQNGHTLLFVEEASVKFSKSKKIEQVSQRTTGQKELHGDIVYLRIDADFNPGKDIASLSYSTDGTTWHKLGEDFKMKYDFTRLFMGSRFAIFNYTTEKPGGHVDIDWFHFSCGEK